MASQLSCISRHPKSEESVRRRRWSSARGQSMAEMSLVLPLFLLLVFGIVEIGRAFAARQALTSAAREGARILVLPFGPGLPYTTEGAVQAAALNRARAYLSSSGVSIGQETEIRRVRLVPGDDGAYGTSDDPAPEPDYTGAVRGERVGLQITHHFETPLPMVVRIIGDRDEAAPDDSAVTIRLRVASYMTHE
ncbi:MAG: TadE family protein [Blastocatellia bacterium]